MINVAILGLGKVGQSLLEAIEGDPALKNRMNITGLWNRSPEVFQDIRVSSGIRVYSQMDALISDLSGIDLVVECAHPSVMRTYASTILQKADFFISSPTAFADAGFLQAIRNRQNRSAHNCYLGLGASLGVWDIIRLDQGQQLKSLVVEMKKHPDSFKLPDPEMQTRLQASRETEGDHLLADGTIAEINRLAPQNTNTMSIYALAASTLGFSNCKARITANRNMDTHLVHCSVETHKGLRLDFKRDNPAGHGQVTGSATFHSFLTSVTQTASGVRHGGFVFC